MIDAIDGILENSDVEFDGADFKVNVVGSNRSGVIMGNKENDLVAFTPDIVVKDVAQEEIVVTLFLAIITDWVFV